MKAIHSFLGLQTTDVNHDARISALEENGGGGSEKGGSIDTCGDFNFNGN